jgi:Ca-activated chloride channel homolog
MSHRRLLASVVVLSGIITAPAASADSNITLDARLAQPVMKEGIAQKNYLRVALGGCRPEPKDSRTPVNVAFVIDRSGSMAGDRIAQAREAAIMAIRRLEPDDIASVIVFDTRADVLIPAQKVTNPDYFIEQVRRIGLGGQTAIHDGVLKGRGEVLTYMDPRRLNRILLLSDGQANIGPSRVEDFTRLGQALLRERISVSTIGLGLGYNEDLMLQLALASDGNHAFARDPSDLITIFNREFNDVLASCAQTVSIDIDLKPGIRAVKAISRDGVITGSTAQFRMNQVYAATEHYVLLEVEFDKEQATGGEQDVGVIKVAYTDARSGEAQKLDTTVRARFSASAEDVRANADTKVGEAVVEQVTRARAREAVILRDQGRFDDARTLLQQNATEINAFAASVPNAPQQLIDLGNQYRALGSVSAAPATPAQQSYERKMLRKLENSGAGAATRY